MPEESVATKPKKAGRIAHGLYAKRCASAVGQLQQFDALHNELKKEFFRAGRARRSAFSIWSNFIGRRERFGGCEPRQCFAIASPKKSWRRKGSRRDSQIIVKAREEHNLLQTLEATASNGVAGDAAVGKKISGKI